MIDRGLQIAGALIAIAFVLYLAWLIINPGATPPDDEEE